ncbi:MAG: FAD-dependent oxidoreductase [Proteobacteria bacterium]|nr:FAD-dependent oxidoreductase [Pseudomonadota bacterium]
MSKLNYPGADFDDVAWRLLSPQDYQNPRPQSRHHLVVVGAGPAGLISAIGAAGLGAKVALIERHRMGGDCLNVGCMPSKALLSFSKQGPSDFQQAFAWLREVRAGIAPHDSVQRYSEAGVDVFLGDAEFNDDGDICVDAVPLNARRIALCTGASAAVPPIPGLAAANPLTNETVFDLPAAPESLAILGAGAIGCELAQALARLGVKVSLFEMADRVLPNETVLASAAVAAALTGAGVDLYLGQGVEAIRDQGIVVCGDKTVSCERVLVALGRKPNTDGLNLPAAGVRTDAQGFVMTNAKLQSSNKEIFAAGDCTARLQFTHHADAQARALIQNALFAPTAKVDGLIVPHCTYTDPEVAAVGANPVQLQQQGVAFDTFAFDLNELDRSRADPRVLNGSVQQAEGYTQQGADKILGATIVGYDAGELLAPICLMMSNGLGLVAAQKTLFSYPTRSEYLKRLSDAYNKQRMTPTVAKLFQWWLGRTL